MQRLPREQQILLCTQGAGPPARLSRAEEQSRHHVEDAGDIADFYPKYHCELNFIERVWGETKRHTRKNCHFNFQQMTVQVPTTIRSIDIKHVRNYHRRIWRYLDAYSKELNGRMAEWAVQKYKGHRKVSENVDKMMEEMNKEMNKENK